MFVLNYRCSNVLYSCVYQCVPQGDQVDEFRGSDNPPKPDCLSLCLVPIVLQCSRSMPAVPGCVATSECCCSPAMASPVLPWHGQAARLLFSLFSWFPLPSFSCPEFSILYHNCGNVQKMNLLILAFIQGSLWLVFFFNHEALL